MATLVQKNLQQAKKKDQYKGVREEWIKHNYLIYLQGLNIYINIYMENEYPLVELSFFLNTSVFMDKSKQPCRSTLKVFWNAVTNPFWF